MEESREGIVEREFIQAGPGLLFHMLIRGCTFPVEALTSIHEHPDMPSMLSMPLATHFAKNSRHSMTRPAELCLAKP